MDDWVIDVRNLTKKFHHVLAVNGIDLQVARGEVFGFLGPNGSGKTTTIRMLCGLLTPDAGSGHCLGYDVIKNTNSIKSNVGYMTQRYSLYEDLSVMENLTFVARIYGLANRQQKVKDVIDKIGLNERVNQLTGQLSGGWKQRVALAAALLHEPKLLLLDEPTAGVDPNARRQFWDKIHELSQEGITTLVSTHYMDEAERCDRISYLAEGKIITMGTIREVIAQSGLITWSVHGRHLGQLLTKLKNEIGIKQTVTFGAALHISGYDAEMLMKLVAKYQQDYEWQLVDNNLEDVFISLIER